MFNTLSSALSAVEVGAGPLVVLCHGVTDNAASLSDLVRRLAPEYRIVALDCLGHGLSRRFHDDELAAPLDSALVALEDALEVLVQEHGPALVIGHSMGGALASRLATKRPELFTGLICEDPAWLSPEQASSYKTSLPRIRASHEDIRRDPAAALAANRCAYPDWPEDERPGWLAGKLQVDPDFLAVGEMGYVDWCEWVGEIAVPTLVVSSDGEDVLLGHSGLAKIDALGNSHIATALLPGCGHCVRRDNAQGFSDLIAPFLDRVHPPLDFAAAIRRPGTGPQVGAQPSATASFFIQPELRAALAQPYYPQWDPIGTRERGRQALAPIPVVKGVQLTVAEIDGLETRVWAPPAPSAVVVSLHGGGFMAGSARADDERNADMARRLNAAVVSPEYRLTPEHPFPAGALDCSTIAEWAMTEWDLPFYLYGDSAGGSLAETVAAMLLEDGRRIDGLIMIEPFLDPSMSGRSIRTYANAQTWNRDKSYHAWKAYLDGRHPRVLPRLVGVVEHRPRVLTIVASADVLRDEGIAWTTALVDAGFDAALHMLSGTYHVGLTIPGTRVRERVFGLITDFMAAQAERPE
ncbi:alpha/beta hydrolase [Trueperella pyogenes]